MRAPSAALTAGATGVVGWRRLTPICSTCAGERPVLTFAAFGRLVAGAEAFLEVRGDTGVDDAAFASLVPGGSADGADLDDAARASLLAAEVTLLQARLDDVQQRLDQLIRRSDNDPRR